MPALVDAVHESLAQSRAKGLGKTEAVRVLGYADLGGSKSKLMKSKEFLARVEEIKPTLPWSGTRDVGPVIDELAKAALLAMQKADKEISAPWLKAAGELFRIVADLKQRLPVDAAPPTAAAPPPEPPMTPEEWVRRFQPQP